MKLAKSNWSSYVNYTMDGLNQFTDGYALIIGVGADLPVTVVDAGAINDILIDPARAGYPPQNVKLLTEANATRANILTAFDELAKSVALNPRATVIIYYSGHGGFDKRDDEYYLVPFGFKPADRVNTGITAQEFTAKINAINSQKLVTFLDCCHAGGMVIKKDIQDTEFLKYIKDDNFTEKSPIDLVQQLGQGQGRVFIASSLANEYSIAAKPYSIFTECLIKALAGEGSLENNDGFASIFEVTSYLLTAVPQRSAEFPPNTETQHPILKYADLTQDFPLCYYAGGQKKKIGFPTAPTHVFSNSQHENTLTIYGVIYERFESGEIQPVRDAKVKVSKIMDGAAITNIDGNFMLTNVLKNTKGIDVFWNNQIYKLPIREDGEYELKKEFVKKFNLIETLIKDTFWQKAIILLFGLIAFFALIGFILLNPPSIQEPTIKFIVVLLTGLISAVVLFLLVPPSIKYQKVTIVTSTGFLLAIMLLFIDYIERTHPRKSGRIIGVGEIDKRETPLTGVNVTLIPRNEKKLTDVAGNFDFHFVKEDENKIEVSSNEFPRQEFKFIEDNQDYKIVITKKDSRIANEQSLNDVWTEIKDEKKIKICRKACEESYPDRNYNFQLFKLYQENIRHENGYPTFYVEWGLPSSSNSAEICNSEPSKDNKLEFIGASDYDENLFKKYRKWQLGTTNPYVVIDFVSCVAIKKGDQRITVENWEARTWSQK